MILVGNQVEAAMYTTKIILLKFFNLFDLSVNRSSPMADIPWIPSSSSNFNSNAAVVELPSTQINVKQASPDTATLNQYQMILLYPSICFTLS